MVDRLYPCSTIATVDREGRALQRCTLSARSMPRDGQGYMDSHMPLPSCPSFGLKAQNLRYCGEDAITIFEYRKAPPGQTYVYIFKPKGMVCIDCLKSICFLSSTFAILLCLRCVAQLVQQQFS